MKRTILNTAIAAMLLLCAAPALRAQELKVAYTRVNLTTSGNVTGNGISGTVHYNHTDTTLTLNGATITAMGDNDGIYSDVGGLKIILQDNNKIEASVAAIYHRKPLTIKGAGTLTATSTNFTAIFAKQADLTIEDGCTVIAKGKYGIAGENGSDEVLTIKNSTVKATGTNNGSIAKFKYLVLNGCGITSPAGATFDDTRTPKGVYAGNTLVKREVLITPTGAGLQTTEAAAARIYPNPVGNTLYIDADESIQLLQLYDMQGRQLLATEPQQKSFNIDLSTLGNGIYLLKLRTAKGTGEYKVVKSEL